MAVVHFVRKVPAADGVLVPARGGLRFTPTARRVIVGAPDVVVLPASFSVQLVNGAADVTLEPTTGAWVWRVDEYCTGTPARTTHVTVPAVAELDDTDLVIVDPATLEPAAEPEPIWTTQLAGKVDVADVGAADGVAPLGADSKVPAAYLPPVAAGSVASTGITDSTVTGRALITATDAPTARTAIGAGTSNLTLGTTAGTAMAGDRAFTKADVGLGNVDNTTDAAKPVSTAQQAALDAKVDDTEKGAINGVATLGADGKVPAAQLPPSGGSSYELRGTGNPEGVVTASPGTYYTDTAGTTGAWRWFKQTGTGATGWIVQLGDTGWRNVAGNFTLTDFPTMVIQIKRVNQTVVGRCTFDATQAARTHRTIGAWPAGFVPYLAGGKEKCAIVGEAASAVIAGFLNLHEAGFYLYHNGNATSGSAAQFRFETAAAWPATLPGTAV